MLLVSCVCMSTVCLSGVLWPITQHVHRILKCMLLVSCACFRCPATQHVYCISVCQLCVFQVSCNSVCLLYHCMLAVCVSGVQQLDMHTVSVYVSCACFRYPTTQNEYAVSRGVWVAERLKVPLLHQPSGKSPEKFWVHQWMGWPHICTGKT